MKKKALIFLDYDMLIRHFILSGVFHELEQKYEVAYVFHHDLTSEKQGIYADIEKLGLKNWIRFAVPRVRMGSWDKLYSITTLNAQRGTPNFKPRKEIMAVARGKWRTNYYHFLSLPGLFPLVQARLQRQMGVYEPLLDFVCDQNPDVIIHPSILAGYFINELLIISRRRSIPLVIMMNSWDNPSTKAMNTGHPDRLIVWGPQSKQHAIEYIGMSPESIEEFGAAQFQLYRDPLKESEAALRKEFHVPSDLPILLYGGGSKGVNESAHLKMIDEKIDSGEISPCHVLYRPHPWRGELAPGEQNFFDLRLRHVTMDPHMEDYYSRTADAHCAGFDLADYQVTKRLLSLVSGVISPLSTILLESIIFGKPVLVFFSKTEQSNLAKTIYGIGIRLAHFKDFWGEPGIEVCNDDAQLPAACNRLLVNSQNESIKTGLQAHAEKFVVMNGPTYGERLVTLVAQLTHRLASASTKQESVAS